MFIVLAKDLYSLIRIKTKKNDNEILELFIARKRERVGDR